MSDPTEIHLFNQDDEILTPKHSIPLNIHSLQVSGSKGHFLSNFQCSVSSFDVFPKPSFSPLTKYEQLYQDAAKRNNVRDKMMIYAKAKKEREEESFKSDRKLSKAESSELFLRLNKEAETRKERMKISEKIKADQEKKQLKEPMINNPGVKYNQDVVSRLLQYGENSKRKIEEKLRKKQEKEDQELQRMLSHKRIRSEATLGSNISTPLKDSSFSTNKSVLNSHNSPDKVIQKIQSLCLSKFSPIPKRGSSTK